MMNVARRQQRKRAVAMFVIIPLEKRLAEGARLREAGKRRWKLRLVLQRLEMRFDVRVVVGNVRP